jgi:hypothetical protein
LPLDEIRQAMIPDPDATPREQAQRLDREAAAVAEDASCVGQWHVDRLRAEAGPDVTAAQAREALERHGVRVARLPSLPAEPPEHLAPYPDFTDSVARLGRKLSMDLVFDNTAYVFHLLDGLRLDDGRRLDREAIEEAGREIPLSVNHHDWERILCVLADAAEKPQVIDDVVWWEVAEVLRALARLDYPQRAITEQAVRLSLERREAEVLAAAVAQEHQARNSIQQSPPPREVPETGQFASGPEGAATPDPAREPDPPVADVGFRGTLESVMDLHSRAMPGRADIVQLSWTPPSSGVVSLRMAGQPPSWPVGTAIASQDVDSYGQPLSAGGMLGPDQRMSRELSLPEDRTFVTAFTIRDADAVSGRTVEITREAPVRGLSWQRFGEEVRLAWTWPDETIAAYVAWQPMAETDQPMPAAARQQRRCSRRAFEAEGGFAAVMGHTAQRVEVWAVFAGQGKENLTAPAEIEVPAIGILVPYRFRRVLGPRDAVGRRRRRELVVSSEQPCVVPDLIVVECRHPGIPLIPHDGEIVDQIPGGPVDPSRPLRKMVELGPHGPSWIVCFVDPVQSPMRRSQVTLDMPPVKQLRVR